MDNPKNKAKAPNTGKPKAAAKPAARQTVPARPGKVRAAVPQN